MPKGIAVRHRSFRGSEACDGYDVAWSHYTFGAGGLTLTAITYFVVRDRDAYLFNLVTSVDISDDGRFLYTAAW